MTEARSMVDNLSRDAESKRELLQEKQREAEEALQAITASMERAADHKQELETIQNQLSLEEV